MTRDTDFGRPDEDPDYGVPTPPEPLSESASIKAAWESSPPRCSATHPDETTPSWTTRCADDEGHPGLHWHANRHRFVRGNSYTTVLTITKEPHDP
jgi:hypothetical protein